ncbi:MAG: helix-turn-helix domain-containing protein [Faecalimonas sp.]
MKIYEKIFDRLDELHMSQMELSRRTGIATSTISDWRKKKINPQADKIVSICRALDMSLVDLLCDEETVEPAAQIDCLTNENYMIELFRQSDAESKRRIISYIELLEVCKQINNACQSRKRQRNVSIIQDIDGNNIVVINDIRFKGKRSINWKEVRAYLKEYVGDFYKVASTGDVIYIGSDLPSEYSGSVYTKRLNGAVAKAKANATQGIPEMIEISTGRYFRENNKGKHNWNARNGWYRYDTYFALPVYGDNEDIERYNVFHASLIIRHANDGKMYLYDILDIKKETSTPLEP